MCPPFWLHQAGCWPVHQRSSPPRAAAFPAVSPRPATCLHERHDGRPAAFPRQRQRDAPSTIAADGQRFSPPVNAVVLSKRNGARRRYCDIHAVAVGDLVQSCTGFEVAKCKFGDYRFSFSWLVQLLPSPTTSPSMRLQTRTTPGFLEKILPSRPNRTADRLSSSDNERDGYRPFCRRPVTQTSLAVSGIAEKSFYTQ